MYWMNFLSPWLAKPLKNQFRSTALHLAVIVQRQLGLLLEDFKELRQQGPWIPGIPGIPKSFPGRTGLLPKLVNLYRKPMGKSMERWENPSIHGINELTRHFPVRKMCQSTRGYHLFWDSEAKLKLWTLISRHENSPGKLIVVFEVSSANTLSYIAHYLCIFTYFNHGFIPNVGSLNPDFFFR